MEVLEFRFAFYARDFERSVAFYRDVLEMKLTDSWSRADGKGALLSAGGIAVIEIFGAAEGGIYDGPRPVAINLALRVADPAAVDVYYEKLLSTGVRLGGPPKDHEWGQRSFVAYDPDEIAIDIYCEIEPA